MIRIENLEKKFIGRRTVLSNINAVINDGDVIGVIGPSGTGKSTFLRCINMLDPATGGAIFFDDENIMAKGYDVNKFRQKVGMVFQSFNLFEHKTAIENIMMPQVHLLNKTKQEAFDRGMELLDKVGLKSKYLSYPATMSGGQKQRVAIARALAMNPKVILFDEPTSALDPTMVGEVENIIKGLAKSGITMMIVTHEMRLARSICNRIFYMDKGGLYEEGTTEQIFENPTRERTRAFIKNLKTFTVSFNGTTAMAEITESLKAFLSNNDIAENNSRRIEDFIWDIVIHALPILKENDTEMRILAEYDAKEQITSVIIYAAIDEKDVPHQLELIKNKLNGNEYVSFDSVETIEDDRYNHKFSFTLK